MQGLRKMRRTEMLAAVLALTLAVAVAAMLYVRHSFPGSRGDHARIAGGQLVGHASEAPPSTVDYRRLEQRIGKLMQDPDMVGLAVGTVERGHVRFLRGFGETLAGSGRPVTPDTVFRWASLSKGVASARHRPRRGGKAVA